MSRSFPEAPRPILLLEMNEIPWRLLDLYRNDARFPAIRTFFSRASTFTTLAVDSGELSPWVTWPTFHRGMSNTEHGIRNLGQDPSTFKGVPIWEEFRRSGYSIGVCGSLQSWPPMDPGEGGFFIPDTFAHDERCIPAYIEAFQRFNLRQVRANGRVVKGATVGGSDALSLVMAMPRLGIRFKTMRRIAGQLARERGDKAALARRPIFQTVLAWDIFRKHYRVDDPPRFSSFFTNHVAGVMHRYWDHVFPEDFGRSGMPRPHKATMDFAMDVMSGILRDALAWMDRNPDIIAVFATSMGQAAIRRDEHEGYEASIPGVAELMAVCGLESGQFTPLLAMVPQIAIQISDRAARLQTVRVLEGCRTRSGARLFEVQEIGESLSITIRTPRKADIAAGGFSAPESGGHTRWVGWDAAGIQMNEVEAGTAYHIPEGILAVCDTKKAASDARTVVKASDVKAMLTEWSGLHASH
jgi:hypothetical protein